MLELNVYLSDCSRNSTSSVSAADEETSSFGLHFPRSQVILPKKDFFFFSGKFVQPNLLPRPTVGLRINDAIPLGGCGSDVKCNDLNQGQG